MAKVIVGQHAVLEELLIAIFARGHCLLIGVPGLAKTLMIHTLADALNLTYNRIQFTPDLMPSDITGTEVIQEDKATGVRQFKFLERAGLRQYRAGRRDQPYSSQDAGRPPGGDAGAASDGRRASGTGSPTRSSCWRPRTRSSRKGPIRSPRLSSTASCSISWSATRRRKKSSTSCG